MATGMLIHDDRYLRNIFIGLMYLGVLYFCPEVVLFGLYSWIDDDYFDFFQYILMRIRIQPMVICWRAFVSLINDGISIYGFRDCCLFAYSYDGV